MRFAILLSMVSCMSLGACTSSLMRDKPDPQSALAIKRLKIMDLDGDGLLYLREALDYNIKNFKKMDKNRDERLSTKEYQAQIDTNSYDAANRFQAMDSNGDKQLSLAETISGINSFFSRYDKNGDNLIAIREIMQSKRPSSRRGGRPSGATGKGRPSDGSGRSGGGRPKW